MTGDKGWLMREFARARERSSKIPPFARPVVINRRKRDDATDGYAYTVQKVAAIAIDCPLCEQEIKFYVGVESWTRLDEDSVSRMRISVPLVHTCTEGRE